MDDKAWVFAGLVLAAIAGQVKILFEQAAQARMAERARADVQADAARKDTALGEIHQLVDGNLSTALAKIDALRAMVVDLMERPALSLAQKAEVLATPEMARDGGSEVNR